LRGPIDVYKRERRHPEARDVGLIVEVAVTSLTSDLTVRAEKFARALVPNYWVVDVSNRRIVAHAGPQIIDGVGSYAHADSREHGDHIRLVLDGQEVAAIPVADLIW
jgi:Putative restriction endonuclease